MKATMRWMGFAMALALAPALAGAQAHDMSTMGKDTAKKDSMAGMQGKMGTKMKMDSGMKHDMAGMHGGMGAGMRMSTGWGELDALHGMLMTTWHPAEKDSLALARSLAPALASVTDAWTRSKGPASCDNAAARKLMPVVAADVKAYVVEVARKGTDADVKAALKRVHDGFEKVAMPCMMGGMKDMKGMKH